MNRGELEERQLEIANRMKNIIWTVCGDYTLETKPDVEAFLKSKYIALYDGIKQGAFAKYFEKEKLSMYLVKKVYLGAVRMHWWQSRSCVWKKRWETGSFGSEKV